MLERPFHHSWRAFARKTVCFEPENDVAATLPRWKKRWWVGFFCRKPYWSSPVSFPPLEPSPLFSLPSLPSWLLLVLLPALSDSDGAPPSLLSRSSMIFLASFTALSAAERAILADS